MSERAGASRIGATTVRPPPIPVTVIGGYLGAGKTTLVNHLLRHADGLRLAVLVNDFGDIAIDADLIESNDGNVIGIAGGCICCSYGSDMLAALMQLAQRRPRPDHVLLETSGVALPGPVAAALTLLQDYADDGVVVVADATSVRRHAADRYLGDTIQRQLAEADIVVLNKCDLIAAGEREALGNWLRQAAPRARAHATERGRVAFAVVAGSRLLGATSSGRLQLGGHASGIYATLVLEIGAAVDPARLAGALADQRCGLLRSKGLVRGTDGGIWAVQTVGARGEAVPATFLPTRAAVGRLVCIGLTTEIDRKRLLALTDCFGELG